MASPTVAAYHPLQYKNSFSLETKYMNTSKCLHFQTKQNNKDYIRDNFNLCQKKQLPVGYTGLNFESIKQWTISYKLSHSYQIVFNKIICKAEWWTCCLLKGLKFSLRRKIKWTADYVDSMQQVHNFVSTMQGV